MLQESMLSPPRLFLTKSLLDMSSMTSLGHSSFATNDNDSFNTQRAELRRIDSINSNSTSSDDELEINRFIDLANVKKQLKEHLIKEAALQDALQKPSYEIRIQNIKVQLQLTQKQIERYEPILMSIFRKYNENKSLSNDEQLLLQMKQRAMLFRQSTKIKPNVAASYICHGVQRFFKQNHSEKNEIEFKRRLTLIKIAIEANNPNQLMKTLDTAYNLPYDHKEDYKDDHPYDHLYMLARLLLEAIAHCEHKKNRVVLKGTLFQYIISLDEVYVHNNPTYKSEPYFFKLALLLANDKIKAELTPLLEPLQLLYKATANISDKILINSTLSNIEAQFLKYIKSIVESKSESSSVPNLRHLAIVCSERLGDFLTLCSPCLDYSILQAHQNICSIFEAITQKNSLLIPAAIHCASSLHTSPQQEKLSLTLSQ